LSQKKDDGGRWILEVRLKKARGEDGREEDGRGRFHNTGLGGGESQKITLGNGKGQTQILQRLLWGRNLQ